MEKKITSNIINKERLQQDCGIAYTLSVLDGRWKISILALLLANKILRYSELRKKLSGISERMLAAQLKELEGDGLITRTAHPEVPPKVEYALTEKGASLDRILHAMSEWGLRNGQPGIFAGRGL